MIIKTISLNNGKTELILRFRISSILWLWIRKSTWRDCRCQKEEGTYSRREREEKATTKAVELELQS